MAILSRIASMIPACHRFRWPSPAVVILLAVCASTGAQDQPTDYQVKAAFLEKFGKFVEWPDNTFASPAAPVVIGVFIDDPFGDALKSFAERDTINGRAIEVRQVQNVAELKDCNVIFIPASARESEREALAAVAGSPVLTVGETDDFYDAGGMIEFIIENKQVHFRIRNEAARAAGLKISSKLLILARRT